MRIEGTTEKVGAGNRRFAMKFAVIALEKIAAKRGACRMKIVAPRKLTANGKLFP
jgi:hypothetical protein